VFRSPLGVSFGEIGLLSVFFGPPRHRIQRAAEEVVVWEKSCSTGSIPECGLR
jgi:hypothetical protein